MTDVANAASMADVTVVNLNDGSTATTDSRGNFSIAANAGDRLQFTTTGYTTEIVNVPPNIPLLKVQLSQQNIHLKEFVLHSELTPFQKDSVAMHDLYQQELERKRIKPKVTGLTVENPISSLAQAVSKRYKQNKQFKATFLKDEQQKFIDTRYTPKLVTTLTGFRGDSLAVFMNAYPMDYLFARAATDLELKMWVRDNYKRYISGDAALGK